MRAVYILWLRQVKKYFRSKSRMIGSLGQPLLFLVAMGFGFGPIFQMAGGGNYMNFLVPGIVAMSILFTSTFMGIEIIWDRQFGFLKETLVAPVPRIHIMIGRTLGGATVAVFQGCIVMILSLFVGFKPVSLGGVILAIIFMIMVATIFTAIGTALGCIMNDIHGFQLIVNFLIMPLFFLSGALFPLDGLPKLIQIFTYFNPLSYGVDGIRLSLTGVSHFGFLLDFGVLFVLMTFFLVLGGYLFSRMKV
jgi:ABC-2 type transport system permease protein